MTAHGKTWFVSDVHLYYGGHDYLLQFLDFLDFAARSDVERLLIVGDLFEFWIGDRQAAIDFYRPLLEKLRALIERGVAVEIIHGNRDFLIGRAFEEVGARLLPDEIVLDLGGRRVHVSHGDQFCIHDHSYQRARVVMRSKIVRAVSACLPASLGLMLARAYRGISERKKSRMKAGTGNRFHTVEDGIRAELERKRHDVIVCGHIHYPKDQVIDVGGRRHRVITTGAWEEGPNYVEFDGTDLELRRFGRTAAAAH